MVDTPREALQSLVDLYHREFRGPPPQGLHDAIMEADYGLKGIDRFGDPWAPPVPIDFREDDVQASLTKLCDRFSGPLMNRAPQHILDIVDEARRHIADPSPSP